jgi:hypothetical protein
VHCGGGGQVLVMARQCDAQEEPRHPESPLHALPAELFDYLVRLLAAEPECWLVEEPRIDPAAPPQQRQAPPSVNLGAVRPINCLNPYGIASHASPACAA